MLRTMITLAALAALPGAAFAQALEAQPSLEKREKRVDAPPITAYKIILVGDSTTQVLSGYYGFNGKINGVMVDTAVWSASDIQAFYNANKDKTAGW